MSSKLTKRVVDAAESRGTRYTIFDSALAGFGLRVFPSGEKSWIFEYRPAEGGRSASKRRMTLGRVTDFTPDQARKVADGLRSAVKTGKDPQADKATQREALTVEQLAAMFLAGHVDTKRRASTKAHYEDVLKRLVLPKLGKRKAKDVTRAEVARVHLANAATPFQAKSECPSGACSRAFLRSLWRQPLWSSRRAAALPEGEVRALTFFSLILAIASLIFVNRSFGASVIAAMRPPNRTLLLVLTGVAAMLAVVLFWPVASGLFHFGQPHWDGLLIFFAGGLPCWSLSRG